MNLVAKRKTLFDDRPVEISELTYVIKQDLAALNQNIASLASFTQSQHPKATRSKMDQEGEHNDNVSGNPIWSEIRALLNELVS
jgi:syntaxin 5